MKKTSIISIIPFLTITAVLMLPGTAALQDTGAYAFREIWGYLMAGEERSITGREPFTDICYFSATVNARGKLVSSLDRARVPAASRPLRVHAVVTELSNPSLTHFCLNPELPYRKALLNDIGALTKKFDGIQVDFESVMHTDADWFHSFLADIKETIGENKILSAAIPARRLKTIPDAYDYETISSIVDRVVIMAYDQHWSTSEAGPVAALSWCRDIAKHARSAVPGGKLVMGIPLYGRAWQDKKINRALRHDHVEKLLSSTGMTPSYDQDMGHFFEYDDSVKVRVYYSSRQSLSDKLSLYRSNGIGAVAFWRIGQGPAVIWENITIED